MIKRNLYKWHRTLSVLIAIPVMMWTVSGIMHPIMSSFKPKIENQFVKKEAIDPTRLRFSLKQALEKNSISSVVNFNVVKLDTAWVYQLKMKNTEKLTYCSAYDGSIVAAGDSLYAIQLARNILGNKSNVNSVAFVKNFDDEYVYVNRYLPVFKIAFQREDGLRIYVDTFGSRMALAMNDNRASFNKFFINFHSWGFLNKLGNFRLVVIVLITALAFITACMGIGIWFLIARKNKSSNEKTKHRRLHSRLGIFTSITTLMFSFSGCFHAFKKFDPDRRMQFFFEPQISSKQLDLDVAQLQSALSGKPAITNISVAEINGKTYWQISLAEAKQTEAEKIYLDTKTYTELKDGEAAYATFLANRFSKNTSDDISEIELLSSFSSEYGFVNKRLPVIKVQYSKNDNERYYIETSTGKLSTKIQDKDLYEGLSFAFFHKFHFLEPLGKTGRDMATAVAASANLLLTLTGVILFIRFLRKRRKQSKHPGR